MLDELFPGFLDGLVAVGVPSPANLNRFYLDFNVHGLCAADAGCAGSPTGTW